MMNAKRSNFNILWKYISLIPILTVLVCGLNKSVAQKKLISGSRELPGNEIINLSANKQLIEEDAINGNDKAGSFQPGDSSLKKRMIEKPEPLKSVDSINIFSLRNLGITSEYIRSFKEIGYNNLSIQDLKVLRMQGVTALYIKGFQDIGYDKLSVKTIESLKMNGITPEYVKGLLDLGYTNLSLNKLPSPQ